MLCMRREHRNEPHRREHSYGERERENEREISATSVSLVARENALCLYPTQHVTKSVHTKLSFILIHSFCFKTQKYDPQVFACERSRMLPLSPVSVCVRARCRIRLRPFVSWLCVCASLSAVSVCVHVFKRGSRVFISYAFTVCVYYVV